MGIENKQNSMGDPDGPEGITPEEAGHRGLTNLPPVAQAVRSAHEHGRGGDVMIDTERARVEFTGPAAGAVADLVANAVEGSRVVTEPIAGSPDSHVVATGSLGEDHVTIAGIRRPRGDSVEQVTVTLGKPKENPKDL